MANTQREIVQRAKSVFERCSAIDLAASVTDCAAKPHAQKFQFAIREFEALADVTDFTYRLKGTIANAEVLPSWSVASMMPSCESSRAFTFFTTISGNHEKLTPMQMQYSPNGFAR
jgi:hypothetical protein